MKPITFVLPAVAAALVAALLAGCSPETVEGVKRDTVRNAETVRREAKPALTKLNLGGRVTAALQANERLPHTIRVDASETGVTLRGKVKTAEQKTLAGRIARQTLSDDKTVKNEIKVSE